MIVALEQRGRGIGKLEHLPGGDQARAGRGVADEIGHAARALVEAQPVGLAAEIGIAEFARRRRVGRDRPADRHEVLVGNRLGGEVDDAAAEFARIVDRIGLLDERGPDDRGREDVERHRAAQRLGARQGRTVEQRRGIAIAEAADIDEAAAHDAEAGDASQRAGDIALARARDVLARQHRHHLRGGAHDVRDMAPDHDDVGHVHVHARRGDLGGLLLRLRIGGGRRGRRLPRRLGERGRRDELRRQEKKRGVSKASLHGRVTQ